MKKNIVFLIILSIIGLLFYSCANIGSLSGGDMDSIPPEMLASNPPDKGNNFSGDKIIIQFDEFFQLAGVEEAFISSPPLKEKPKFSIKKKNFVIKLNEELQDTTTYSFTFGDAIKDFHEGNPLLDFKFVFSTGEIVDSFRIAGKLTDAFNLTNAERYKVMLYRSWQDSTPLLDTPYYITKTDTSGNFDFDFIKTGKYRIFALNDADDNYLYNLPNEKIAFLDSFIIPEVTVDIHYDTIPEGTILHDKATGDSIGFLLKDSVIVTKKNIYKPDSLYLFSFLEKPERQYIKKSERLGKGKFRFIYNIAQDTVLINCSDSNYTASKTIIEKNARGDTVILWISQPEIYNTDTLIFTNSIYNLDSLENYVKETDTVELVVRKKKKSIKRKKDKENIDTIPKKKYLNFILPKGDQHLYKPYTFETQNPISSFDTSKIEFFEIVDTAFYEDRTQKIEFSGRIDNDMLLFVFKRPVIDDIGLRFLNYWNPDIWYSSTYTENRDSVFCEITDEKIIELDTIKLFLDYDNDFFLNQVQKFEDSLSVSIQKQEISSLVRSKKDTVKISFIKPITRRFTARSIINKDSLPEDVFNISYNKNSSTAKLTLKDTSFRNIDTLSLIVKMYDFTDTLQNEVMFIDTVEAVYKPDLQFVKSAERIKTKELSIIFNKKLSNGLEFIPINFGNDKKLKKNINKGKDTVNFIFSDKKIYKKDTLIFTVKYPFINRDEAEETKTDTFKVALTIPEKADENKKQKIPASVEMPVNFKFMKDSSTIRKYIIDYAWKDSVSYKAVVDSFAYEDIFSLYNRKKIIDFTVRSSKSYGKIILKLSDIAQIAENNFYSGKNIKDSVLLSKLLKGQVVIKLLDEKAYIIKKLIIKENLDTTLEYINPGKYSLEIFYDENMNDIQDRGNFFDKLQPERKLIYYNPIEIKENFATEINWKIRFKDLNIRVKKKK